MCLIAYHGVCTVQQCIDILTTNLAAVVCVCVCVCVSVCVQNLTNLISTPDIPKFLFAKQHSHPLHLDRFFRSIVLYLLRKTII